VPIAQGAGDREDKVERVGRNELHAVPGGHRPVGGRWHRRRGIRSKSGHPRCQWARSPPHYQFKYQSKVKPSAYKGVHAVQRGAVTGQLSPSGAVEFARLGLGPPRTESREASRRAGVGAKRREGPPPSYVFFTRRRIGARSLRAVWMPEA
jgi:hypothetical protein